MIIYLCIVYTWAIKDPVFFYSYKLSVCLSLIMNHFDKILFFFMPSNVESDKTVHTDASEKLVCSNL